MNWTQIYLTEEEIAALKALSRRTGLNQSELIRKAVDQFIDKHSAARRKGLLTVARGLWKDRRDLPDFEALRREWDRTGS